MDNPMQEIDLLNNILNNFDLDNITDYQKLLYIIYNHFYVVEDANKLSQYKIFSILDKLIGQFNMNDDNKSHYQKSSSNCCQKPTDNNDAWDAYVNSPFYDFFTSKKLLKNSPRYIVKTRDKEGDNIRRKN